MAENAKVVKGLECCLDVHQAGRWASGCIQCPYAGVENCTLVLFHDAIDLLKEQEPVEPITECSDLPFCVKVDYMCGRCHNGIDKMKDKYCSVCGKKIKWNEGIA